MDAVIAPMQPELHEQLRRQSTQSRTDTAQRLHAGEKIKEGGRRPRIFRIARANIERGVPEALVGELMLALNEAQCDPPLARDEVLGQVRGAAKWVPKPDEADVDLRRQADEFLREFEAGEIKASSSGRGEKPSSKRRREIHRRAISTVPPRPVRHLVSEHVPDRTITSVAGPGGLGKSALSLAWAAELTRQGMNVLVISYEDAAEEVIRPRFEALGGDQERLFVLSINPVEGSIVFPLDLEELARHVTETGARLVVIDPISAGIDVRLDSHKDRDVRVVLGQLAKLAEELGLAIVLIVHLNKSPSNDAYTRVSGSVGFYNASRSVVVVTRDPLDPDWRRLVAQVKSNYGRLAPVERWRVELADVPSEEGPIQVARLVFHDIADDVDRDQVLSPPPAEKRGEAEALILVELAEGRRLSADVKAAGIKTGISKRTIERAATALEVVVTEETTEVGRVTYWALPEDLGDRATPPPTQEGATPQEPHNHAENGGRARGSRHETEKRDDATPQPGDSGYLEHLLAFGEQGLLTEAEWFELSAEHERIVREHE
jgi:KaiC/GvpD/RAD55 family RecA-like ATPase